METSRSIVTTTREVVMSYLGFFKEKSGDYERVKPLLSPTLRFNSPIGKFQDAESFVDDLSRDVLSIEEVRVKKLIVDGNTACALYDVSSRNPEIGVVSVTEWFEVRDGKIDSITSTHDATAVKTLLKRI